MEPQRNQPKQKKTHSLRRSISSLMDKDRSIFRSPSSSPTRSTPPSSATAALAKSTTILFVPAATSPPMCRDSSRFSTPGRSPQRSLEHHYTSSIPEPMSYELPPGCPLPSYLPSCPVSYEIPPANYSPSPQKRRRPSTGSSSSIDAKRKPLPPLPLEPTLPSPASSQLSLPLSRVSSLSSMDLRAKVHNHLSIIPEATTPTTPRYPDHNLPAELEDHPKELPGCYPTPPASESADGCRERADLTGPQSEFHVHASSVPDCDICAQQDQFWGFSFVVGLDMPTSSTPPPLHDMPMTPPDTPESAEPDSPGNPLRWSKVAQVPDRGRDITSWLVLSPACSSSGTDDDESLYGDEEPESDIEDLDTGLFKLEQELRRVGRGRRLGNSMATSIGRAW